MSLTEEELMDRAGSEDLEAWHHEHAAEAAEQAREDEMLHRRAAADAASMVGGGKTPGVKNLQRSLKSIGMQVEMTGRVDQATVDALNSIFSGWDDAPPSLRGGNLTAVQISHNLPAVSKYLHMALGGAKDFGDATKEG